MSQLFARKCITTIYSRRNENLKLYYQTSKSNVWNIRYSVNRCYV